MSRDTDHIENDCRNLRGKKDVVSKQKRYSCIDAIPYFVHSFSSKQSYNRGSKRKEKTKKRGLPEANIDNFLHLILNFKNNLNPQMLHSSNQWKFSTRAEAYANFVC